MRPPRPWLFLALFVLAASCNKDQPASKDTPPAATDTARKQATPPATTTAGQTGDAATATDPANNMAINLTDGQKTEGGDPAGAPNAAAGTLAATLPGENSQAIAYYFDRELSASELEKRTLRELSLVRNTIYARAGNPFRKQWLREYFEAQPWYQAGDKVDESKISDIDRKNARTVARVERSFSQAALDQRKTGLLAAIGTGKPTPEQAVEIKLLSTRLGVWIGSDDMPVKTHNPLEDPRALQRVLEYDDLFDMSRRDLRILRNTVYARHGRPFKSNILREYFSAMPWYKPDPSYDDKRLSKTDRANIRLVKSVEEEMGGAISERTHGKILKGDEEDDFLSES